MTIYIIYYTVNLRSPRTSEDIMFEKEKVPPMLWIYANGINDQVIRLEAKIAKVQKECKHKWDKVMGFDPHYSPRVDGRGRGQDVIKSFHCSLCNADKPMSGSSSSVCHKCGSEMKFAGNDHCDGVRVNCYKCVTCGHEFDTT